MFFIYIIVIFQSTFFANTYYCYCQHFEFGVNYTHKRGNIDKREAGFSRAEKNEIDLKGFRNYCRLHLAQTSFQSSIQLVDFKIVFLSRTDIFLLPFYSNMLYAKPNTVHLNAIAVFIVKFSKRFSKKIRYINRYVYLLIQNFITTQIDIAKRASYSYFFNIKWNSKVLDKHAAQIINFQRNSNLHGLILHVQFLGNIQPKWFCFTIDY